MRRSFAKPSGQLNSRDSITEYHFQHWLSWSCIEFHSEAVSSESRMTLTWQLTLKQESWELFASSKQCLIFALRKDFRLIHDTDNMSLEVRKWSHFKKNDASFVACEPQTYFRSSLLFLRFFSVGETRNLSRKNRMLSQATSLGVQFRSSSCNDSTCNV